MSFIINMFYREIILWNGLPFRPSIPKARDEMTKEEFDERMAIGLEQAKNRKACPADEVLDRIIGEIENG